MAGFNVFRSLPTPELQLRCFHFHPERRREIPGNNTSRFPLEDVVFGMTFRPSIKASGFPFFQQQQMQALPEKLGSPPVEPQSGPLLPARSQKLTSPSSPPTAPPSAPRRSPPTGSPTRPTASEALACRPHAACSFPGAAGVGAGCAGWSLLGLHLHLVAESPSTPWSRCGVATLACEAHGLRERAWWAPAPVTLSCRPSAHFHLELHLDLPTARNAVSATLGLKS